MILLHHRFDLSDASASGEGVLGHGLLKRSSLYREFLAEQEEIEKLKWIESEKAGHDIGWHSARIWWVTRHRALWRKSRRSSAETRN